MDTPSSQRADPGSLLTAIVASSNDCIIGKDADFVVTAWNAAAERLYGYTAEEMIGQPIASIVPPNRLPELETIADRLRRGERLSHFETERLTKDGKVVPISLTISPILDPNGQRVGWSTIARDLTGMQHLNRELRLREALLQSMLDIVPDGLVVIDPQGVIQSFNPSAELAFGYAAAEVIGRNVDVLIPSLDLRADDGRSDQHWTNRQPVTTETGRLLVGRCKDGSTFPMELRIGSVDASGAHQFVCFVRDLTARRAGERRLAELTTEVIHLSRLGELGHLASAIAHEVNQPLAAIANYIGGIRRLLTDDSPPVLRQAIMRIAEQASRASEIVKSLRGLVKKGDRPRQTEDLEPLIREAAVLAMVNAQETIQLEVSIGHDTKYIYVDKVQIQQILINLMRNAIESMKGAPGSRLTISTIRVGDRVEFTVFDNGPGVPKEIRDQLFLPFKTTKPDGLGVGLSICRTIVEAHGGELTIESPPNGGALFRFSVPATSDTKILET